MGNRIGSGTAAIRLICYAVIIDATSATVIRCALLCWISIGWNLISTTIWRNGWSSRSVRRNNCRRLL